MTSNTHSVADLLACLHLYNSMKITSASTPPPKLFSQQLIEFSKKLKENDSFAKLNITYPLQTGGREIPHSKRLPRLFQQISKDENLRTRLSPFTMSNTSIETVQLDTNLVQITFQKSQSITKCLSLRCQCKKPLKLRFQNRDGSRGARVIFYHYKKGPQIGVSYQYHCRQKGCTSTYGFGKSFVDGSTIYHQPRSDICQITQSAFIHIKVLEEVSYLLCNGSNYETCAAIYNKRFEEEISEISEKYPNGVGKWSICKLTPELLAIAFPWYSLLRIYYKYLYPNNNEELCLTAADHERIKEKKSATVYHYRNKKRGSGTKAVSLIDKFEYLWDKYYTEIQNITPQCCLRLPVDASGSKAVGSTILYGDGNQKMNRKVCMYPRSLMKSQNKCPENPQGANEYSYGFD